MYNLGSFNSIQELLEFIRSIVFRFDEDPPDDWYTAKNTLYYLNDAVNLLQHIIFDNRDMKEEYKNEYGDSDDFVDIDDLLGEAESVQEELMELVDEYEREAEDLFSKKYPNTFAKAFRYKRDDNKKIMLDENGRPMLIPFFSHARSITKGADKRVEQVNREGVKEYFDKERPGGFHLEHTHFKEGQPGWSVAKWHPKAQEDLWDYVTHNPEDMEDIVIKKVTGKDSGKPGLAGDWHRYITEQTPEKEEFNFLDKSQRERNIAKSLAKAKIRKKLFSDNKSYDTAGKWKEALRLIKANDRKQAKLGLLTDPYSEDNIVLTNKLDENLIEQLNNVFSGDQETVQKVMALYRRSRKRDENVQYPQGDRRSRGAMIYSTPGDITKIDTTPWVMKQYKREFMDNAKKGIVPSDKDFKNINRSLQRSF